MYSKKSVKFTFIFADIIVFSYFLCYNYIKHIAEDFG